MKKYFDRNDREIMAGMHIQISGNTPKLVEVCGEDDLGVLATNPAFLEHHPDAEVEFYPLSNFSKNDLCIINEDNIAYVEEMLDDDLLCERGDEIDNATFDAICAMAQPGTEVEWSMELIGEVNEFIEKVLSDAGVPTCRPYHEDEVICHKTMNRCKHCRK